MCYNLALQGVSKRMEHSIMDHYVHQLKEHGVRVTPQRLVIIKALNELKHPSAEQIHEHLSGDYSNISFATVYNTLRSLKEIDLIREIRCGDGCTRFELSKHEHYHLICKLCGKIEDIEFNPEINYGWIEQQTGFSLEYHNIELFGKCQTCT
jgi:Fur family peroxide stress response transcriptional regulator